MTTNDDDRWAPPSPPAASPSGSGWAPPGHEPPAAADRPPTSPPTPPVAGPPRRLDEPDEPAAPGETVDVDRIEVAAVEASPARSASVFGRLAAAGVAAAMIGGGAYLAFNAASAETGAESPEAAMEAAMAAMENEDLVALAEIMEPTERATLFEAGFDFADELVRLDVLDPGLDLSSIEGIDLEFEGFEPRVERPGNGLAHIYLGEGTVSGVVDVAQLPLGPLLVDRLDEDQLTYTEEAEETEGPTSTPMVAVERDGRWYLSLWYTVAENARLELGQGLPDPGLRPATIGGDSPEAALRQMLDDAVALDLRRVIGSLDPEEMAVLYDYAPLFLDEADELANEALTAARDAGWSWEIVDLRLRSEVDGDLAEVFVEGIHVRADAENGGGIDVEIGEDTFRIDVRLIDDFFGDEFTIAVEVTEDDCLAITSGDGARTETETLCGDELAADLGLSLSELAPAIGGPRLGDQLDSVGVVTRRVDGVWYVSPMRTGLNAAIAAIEQLDPETLAEFADAAIDLGLNGPAGFAVPDLGGPLVDPGFDDFDSDSYEPSFEPANGDLLADGIDPTFAWDLDGGSAASEVDFWAPGLGDQAFTRGVYVTVPAGGGGDVALVVVEVEDPVAVGEAVVAFVEAQGDGATVLEGDALTVQTVDAFDDPLFVDLRGDRLTIVGVYGAELDDARRVLEQQTAGS